MGKIPWRREGLPTPAFWPGKFHGLYGPWSRKESDTTERLSLFIKIASFPEVVIFMDFEYLFPLHRKNEVYPQRAT